MEIVLWRWSTAVQLASALMIAVFFAVLGRSLPRPEVRLWKRAWLANLIAITFTVVFWYVQPTNFLLPLVRATYLGAKMGFVVLLVEGAWASRHLGTTLLTRVRRNVIIGMYALIGGYLLTTIPRLGVTQHTIMGIILLAAAVASMWRGEKGMYWLGAAFFIRGIVAAVEAMAYAVRTLPAAPRPTLFKYAGFVVSTSSSFDVGAEWLIALGCVLAVSNRIQAQLRKSNAELVAAQEELRAMADHDPLTGLDNRRTLPKLFRSIHDTGAKLLFFDLDGFKQINDVHGHHMGDAALIRFAKGLKACFRPDDGIVRYAGDEFLVIAVGMESHLIDERLATLKQKLTEPSLEAPPVRFSVGISDIKPGEKADDALKAADAAMYERKLKRKKAG